jgi:DNA-binding transcriptional ArsR family regulator
MLGRYVYHRNMDVEPSIAFLGALIAVPARANILSALFDGRTLTASELAYAARVTPQTTSSHLAKLVEAKLLTVERHGRHRYYRLAGPEIAEALEPLTLISPHSPVPPRTHAPDVQRLREARFCYDHLAGRLGVVVLEAMLRRRLLIGQGRDFSLSAKGRKFCQELGIEPAQVKAQRRVFARQCLDWSERRPHLAGALGASIAQAFIDRRWIAKARTGRQVTLTEGGRTALGERLGLVL